MLRAAFTVEILTVFAVTLAHRLRSQQTGEPLDRRQEGWFMLLTLRPAGLLFELALVAYLIDPAWMAWSAVPLPEWIRWLGVLTFALGGVLLAWTLRTLGKNLTDTVVTRREHTLVTTGPYGWIRHPFYVAVAILILSVCLVTANWFFLVTGALVLLLLVLRTPMEEQKLLERFGADYAEYRRRTGRFLPTRLAR